MVFEYVDWALPESNDIDDKFIERKKWSYDKFIERKKWRLRVVVYIFIVEVWLYSSNY